MDLILQAIKSLFRKAENAVLQTASALSKRIDAVNFVAKNAQTTANAAKAEAAAATKKADSIDYRMGSKMDIENPVCSGSFSMNRKSGTIVGPSSHAEGFNTTASAGCSHAEGSGTTASGLRSHAEGFNTTASAEGSHAEGAFTKARGEHSHAEGNNSVASGISSHAEGWNTAASGNYSHVEGKYNIKDLVSKYIHIAGNGSSATDLSNAHTLDWGGVPWYQGRPQFGGEAQDDGAQTVMANGDKELIVASSTEGSAKQFKITVDDSGTITATEVTA